jgi:hypothetical protein
VRLLIVGFWVLAAVSLVMMDVRQHSMHAQAPTSVAKQISTQTPAEQSKSIQEQIAAVEKATANSHFWLFMSQMAVLGAVVMKFWDDGRKRRWEHEDLTKKVVAVGASIGAAVSQTNVVIQELEKNTNSIKDALVKATGEAEFAKGLKQGTESAQPK